MVLCRFVAFLVSEGLSHGSIRQYLSALRHHQLLNGGVDPSFTSCHRLHYVLRGCRRSLPSAVRPKRLPITPEILGVLHHHWSSNAQNYDIVCFWAACCLGFFGFLRSGEFTCQSWKGYNPSMLSVSDIAVDSRENPSVLFVSLRRSKTDIFGTGVTIHLGRTGGILCPVSAVLSYLAIRPSSPGPMFILLSGNPLSRDALVTAIRRALGSTTRDVSLFNGHSFRIGAATTAAQAGIPDSTIMQLGRWKSSAFMRYLRPPVETMAAFSSRLLHRQ